MQLSEPVRLGHHEGVRRAPPQCRACKLFGQNEVDAAPPNLTMDKPASSSADAGPPDDTASVAPDDVQDDKKMSVKGDENPAADEKECDPKEAVKDEPSSHEEPQPASSAKAPKADRRKPRG